MIPPGDLAYFPVPVCLQAIATVGGDHLGSAARPEELAISLRSRQSAQNFPCVFPRDFDGVVNHFSYFIDFGYRRRFTKNFHQLIHLLHIR